MLTKTLADIAEHIDAQIDGDPRCEITGIAALDEAVPGQISFLYNPKFAKYLPETQASAVIVTSDFAKHCQVNTLITKDPYTAYARLAELYHCKAPHKPGIHPSAFVDPNATVDPSAFIGPNCVVGEGSIIGARVYLGAGCVIGENCEIGADSELHPNVSCYATVRIGERAVIYSGVVLGANGFGLTKDKGRWQQIPQLGGVLMGDDVSIGANTTIDRGALNDTVLGDGVKLDNLIQIAHNVRIGDHTAIAACSAIAGSTQIGENCLIGGGVGISGHLTIVDNVSLIAMTGVLSSIKKAGVYAGIPAHPHTSWLRNGARFMNLDKLIKRLLKLEKIVLQSNKQTLGSDND